MSTTSPPIVASKKFKKIDDEYVVVAPVRGTENRYWCLSKFAKQKFREKSDKIDYVNLREREILVVKVWQNISRWKPS